MKSYFQVSVALAMILAVGACTRIETGEVGVRVGFDKQVKMRLYDLDMTAQAGLTDSGTQAFTVTTHGQRPKFDGLKV